MFKALVSVRRLGRSQHTQQLRRLSNTKSRVTRTAKRGAPLDIHPEVLDALANRRPVVALETALVTNGLSSPTNLHTARKLESLVREQGAIPATVGIIGGRVKVGLTDAELQRLADVKGNKNIVKVSRRDIGGAIALRKDGGTTICGTLVFAALAGIKVFATGGLGGVHRGGENSLDISADLQELGRSPVGVVCAGAKSILDIGRTLEYLETQGVPVFTYGTNAEFPGFFSPKSGFKSPWNVNDPRIAAEVLLTQWQLGLENGALFAAPLPDEFAESGLKIQAAIDQAVEESEENGMSKRGKEVTPWLLARVSELTGESSVRNNLALLENTAVIGAQIAVEYARIKEELHEGSSGSRDSVRPEHPV